MHCLQVIQGKTNTGINLGKKIVTFLMMVYLSVLTIPTSSITEVKAMVTSQEEDRLLYGYDVTSGKNLMEPDALKTVFPIIDPNSNYKNHIAKFSGAVQNSEAYSSINLSEVAETFAKSVSSNAFGRIFVIDTDISSAFDLSKQVENITSSKYELYSTEIVRYYYIVQLNNEQIKECLSKEFVSDISSVKNKSEAQKLYEKYGTHLITGFSFGGRLNITNYMTTSDSFTDLSKSMSLKDKVSGVTSKINVGQSASIVEEYSSLENTQSSTSTYKFKSYGGEATSSLTLDGLFTYNASYADGSKAGFMYSRWIDSINDDKNLAIIGIPNGAKSIPLWDLMDLTEANYEIRQILIETYIEMCGDAYNAFMAQYPDLEKTYELVREEVSGLPTFNGAYVRTQNGYYYYVDKNDFVSSGNHYGIHKGEYLYLDLEVFTGEGEMSYECQNCEIVDARSGIFKITGSSGNAIITVKSGNKKDNILRLPIISTMCEGGMGNEAYPYIVTTVNHISSIPRENSAYYTLYHDIDFSGVSFSCLGSFSGVLDGNYCTIKNMKIESAKEWGLFSINTGTIKNLKIENSGSSTGYYTFSSGGMNYKQDCGKDEYTKYSIKAVNAGILCATNEGTIDNCYINGGYIRNIIKNDTSWFVNSSMTVSTGVMVGTNSGTIKDCMVKNSNVLGAFINSKENTYGINVFSGGLAGKLNDNCSISSSVVDLGNVSTIMAQIVNPYSKDNAEAVVQAFAGGIAGYSNAVFSMNNTFVYLRNVTSTSKYRAIDAEYTFSSKGLLGMDWLFPREFNPKHYYALKSVVLVVGNNCSIDSRNNYAFSADSMIPLSCIRPSSKNGNNANDNKASYYEINSVYEKNIGSQANFNSLGLTESLYTYDSSSSSTSHINHLLSNNSKNYINLVLDKSNQTTSAVIQDGMMFSPRGIEVTMDVNGTSVPVKVFNINVLDEASNNVTDSYLVTGKQYRIVISMYEENICINEPIKLTVSDNEIVSVSIVPNSFLCHIYYDERDQYFESWDVNNMKFQAKMTNGELLPLEKVTKSEISIVTKASNITKGDNVIWLEYKHNGKSHKVSYVLSVEERKISSISIATPPTKLSYNVGDIVNLDGLQVDINYEVGEPARLSGDDLNQLEIIGQNVSEGKNTVTLLYGGYDNATSFEVQGETSAKYSDFEVQGGTSLKNSEFDTQGEGLEELNNSSDEKRHVLPVIIVSVTIIIGVMVAIVVIRMKKRSKPCNNVDDVSDKMN